MSVIGIDFGNRNAVISYPKQGGIETLLNEASKRATHCYVSFQNDQRFLGDAAIPLMSSNFKNSISDLKRFIGLSWSDEQVQRDLLFLPNRKCFKELEGDRIGIEVHYQNEHMVFTPEDLCAMLLGSLKRTAEFSTGRAVADIVFSVPVYWTDRQRRNFMAATKISSLNVLALINDGTAASLSYGIWKNKSDQFDEAKKEYVMFVNMGQSSFQVTITAYVKGKLSVVASAYDINLGGRNIDLILAKHFAKEFMVKNKCGDPLEQPKGFLKLMSACESLKQMLTPEGVNEAPIKVEYLMDGIDFYSKLKLEDFNDLIMPLMEGLKSPLERVLKDSGLSIGDLTAVEIIGGSTRVRAVKLCIAETLGLNIKKSNYGLSTTQNADECISRGCALRCAMLSPSIRQINYQIKDCVIYPVKVSWEQTELFNTPAEDGDIDGDNCAVESSADENSITLFEKAKEIPMKRRIIFRRREAFEIQAYYSDDIVDELQSKDDRLIGSFRISGMTVKNKEIPSKIRVDFQHDEFGLFSLVSADQIHEIKSDPPQEEQKVPESGPTGDGSAEEAPTPEPEPKKKHEKKFRIAKLTVEPTFNNFFSDSELLNARAREEGFLSHDLVEKARMDIKNDLEEFVYSSRDKLNYVYKDFVTDSERSKLQEKLAETETWLYSEGFNESKSVYEKKLDELREIASVFLARFNESTERPCAVNALRDEISANLKIVNSPDEAYGHIEEAERDVVRKACAELEKWLEDILDKQSQKNPYEDPIVKSSSIYAKVSQLHKQCSPIVTKKRPEVPKEEKEEAVPESDSPQDAADAVPESLNENDASSEENNMDVD